MRNKEQEDITLLGKKKVKYHYDYCPEILETFQNRHPENPYHNSHNKFTVTKVTVFRIPYPQYIISAPLNSLSPVPVPESKKPSFPSPETCSACGYRICPVTEE